MSMEIISVEGLDKCGKYTQTKKLVEHLRLQGFKVVQTEFPRYDTPTGKLIRDWLTKKWNVDQTTIELILAADRQAQQHWFNYLEKRKTDFVIADRYTLSQKGYAISTGSEPEWIDALQRHMRKSDLDIFIDITPEESMRRKGKHGENDRYEDDLELLYKVRSVYEQQADLKINGMQSIDEIHNEIIQGIKPYIKW
jgi:dTMP kinase